MTRYWIGFALILLLISGLLSITCSEGLLITKNNAHADIASAPSPVVTEPFYGMQYVPSSDLGLVKTLGIEVILMDFPHDGPPEAWLAYLDAAHAQNIKVIAWLWPPGWSWDGTTWQIDDQARLFVQTVAQHPALFAVYSLHEPYWNGCNGCGYTTAEQQALYRAIKKIADVPIHSAVDSMAFWTDRGEETAFADGVCDYCETWYYPFKQNGVYEREKFIEHLTADLAVARERAPNSKVVWTIQGFAQGPPYNLRMPTAAEMQDIASILYATDVSGTLWYTWTFNDLYSDFLSNHPELHPVIREIYQADVLSARSRFIYLPIIFHNLPPKPGSGAKVTSQP